VHEPKTVDVLQPDGAVDSTLVREFAANERSSMSGASSSIPTSDHVPALMYAEPFSPERNSRYR
jgi:hypothetical protein